MKARTQLRGWLAERDLDRRLSLSATPAAVNVLRYDQRKSAHSAGDVCLLAPAADWSPVYVLLLEKSHDARWIVVPFGRYAAPAVPGEWRTGLAAIPLRVLCFWNAQEISAEQFVGAPAKYFSKKQFQDAVSVYRYVAHGESAADRLTCRLGPSILHPADPRYEYLDEERERLNDHVRSKDAEIISFEASGASWLLAAEGRPKYGN